MLESRRKNQLRSNSLSSWNRHSHEIVECNPLKCNPFHLFTTLDPNKTVIVSIIVSCPTCLNYLHYERWRDKGTNSPALIAMDLHAAERFANPSEHLCAVVDHLSTRSCLSEHTNCLLFLVIRVNKIISVFIFCHANNSEFSCLDYALAFLALGPLGYLSVQVCRYAQLACSHTFAHSHWNE